jgi:dihydroxyacetone kinase
MNFDMAAEEAEAAGIRVKSVIGADDIASSPDHAARRGVAGIFFGYKVAGACADLHMSLEEVEGETRAALADTRSLGVAISPCTLPGASKANFQLGEGEMEIGMGIHGEQGILRIQREDADAVVDRMMELLIADLKPVKGERLAVLVNSLGATPLEELYIAYNRIADIAASRDLVIERSFIGRYATSLEMSGFSISLLKLNDKRLAYLDHPASSPFVQAGGIRP